MSPALERLLAARAREEREAAERGPGKSNNRPDEAHSPKDPIKLSVNFFLFRFGAGFHHSDN